MTDDITNPANYGPAEIAPEIVNEAPPEAPVKRGPGRPRKDGLPPGSPRTTTTRRRSSGKKSLENDIGGMLVLFNFIFGFMPEPWSGDAFTEQEIIALSSALNAFAQDHARVYKYLSTALIGGGTSGIQLFLVVGQIAQRRLDNHGVKLTTLLGITERPNGDTEPVATE